MACSASLASSDSGGILVYAWRRRICARRRARSDSTRPPASTPQPARTVINRESSRLPTRAGVVTTGASACTVGAGAENVGGVAVEVGEDLVVERVVDTDVVSGGRVVDVGAVG